MSGGKVVDEDSQPLLPHGEVNIAVAAEEARLYAEQPVPTRKWDGGLLQCCGACDMVGVASCLVSRHLPCVAFGYNAKKGFRQSAWLHGFLFLALFGIVFWAAWVGLAAANHNVLATCNGRLPHPPHRPFPRPDPGHWDPEHEPGAKPRDAAFFGLSASKGLPQLGDSDGDDDDGHSHGNDRDHHHGEHHHEDEEDDGHDYKSKHSKGPCKKALHGQGSTWDVPLPNPMAAGGSFRSVGSFVTQRDDASMLIDDADFSDDPDEIYTSPECQQALLLVCGAWVSVIVAALLAVHYAARRRTLLREKFGIAGSKLGDFCTWCWCGSCALCQETRTLWANNVHEGVWHGPTQPQAYTLLSAPTVPISQPPSAQFMSSADVAQARHG